MNDWRKPFGNGAMEQKIFGQKVGHVITMKMGSEDWYVAMYDGAFLGRYRSATEARVAVDTHAVRSASIES